MIVNFDDFILNERLGIGKDLITISDFIYSLIINNPNNDFIINGDDIKTDKIIINKIYINKNKTNNIAEFNVQKSKMTDRGLIIYINFNSESEIKSDVIFHEIQHALDIYYKGKDITSKQLFDIKCAKLALNRMSDEKFKLFVQALYLSDISEINSMTAESYKILSTILRQKQDEKSIKDVFLVEYKKLDSYKAIQFLQNYNVYDLKKTDANDLLMFFNIIDDNYKHLLKYINYTFVDKIKLSIEGIKDVFFQQYKYKKMKKKYKKIEDVERILKKYDKRFKKSADVLTKRIHRLLPLILETE